MSNFSNNAITNNGRALLADVMAGAVFTPTRIAMGSGQLPAGTTPNNITALVTPVKNLAITKKERTPDGKVIVGGVYSNADVTTAFYFRELALFAKAVFLNDDGSVRSEGDEVLYSYGNAGNDADLMPAYSTSTVVERMLDLVTWVGNDAKVDLTIASGVYASAEDLEALRVEFREEFQQGLADHENDKNNPHGVTAAQVGAVKKTGDTMTGALTINKATDWGQIIMNANNGNYRAFETDTKRLRLDARNAGNVNDRHFLDLYDTASADFANALVLAKNSIGTDGKVVTESATVLHTGNIHLIPPSAIGAVKIATGTYTGTGTYGSKEPCILTFDFDLKYIVIQSNNGATMWYIPGNGVAHGQNTSYISPTANYSNRTLSWYSTQNALAQMNAHNETYRWVAFG